MLVCSGAAQALTLLAGVLGAGLEVAVEDPGLPLHREILTAAGASLMALPLDEDGARVEALEQVVPGGGAGHPGPPVADRGGAVGAAGGRPC